MHDVRAGETECLAGHAFQARPQREVCTLNFLHRQFSYRALRGLEIPPIDKPPPCRCDIGDANGLFVCLNHLRALAVGHCTGI